MHNYVSGQILILPSFSGQISPNIFLRPSGFDQNTVGQRQDVICSIVIPSDVDPDSIELNWHNEENIVTNDSRVTIIDTTNDLTNYSTSIIATIIQFDPLFEDDMGNYSCYSKINESVQFVSIQLQNFNCKS